MSIVILTGAGISAESGLATFRGDDGLWNNHPIEEVATIDGFFQNPYKVYDFYEDLSEEIAEAKPNSAHKAIADFQQKADVFLITQNVDLLHEKAGSSQVCHMHGRIDESICLSCGRIVKGLPTAESICPACSVEGMMKPNIVFFGETPQYMDEIEKRLNACHLFIAVGTSGIVYPAAGFVKIAKACGAQTILFNLEEVANAPFFDEQILGKASETLPKFLKELSS